LIKRDAFDKVAGFLSAKIIIAGNLHLTNPVDGVNSLLIWKFRESISIETL